MTKEQAAAKLVQELLLDTHAEEIGVTQRDCLLMARTVVRFLRLRGGMTADEVLARIVADQPPPEEW